jgi:hypothetical protein
MPANNPQTPLATHYVYSPLVGAEGKPADPAASPGVDISISSTGLKVGEYATVIVQPGDIESPIFYLFVRDSGAADITNLAGVSLGMRFTLECIPRGYSNWFLQAVETGNRYFSYEV